LLDGRTVLAVARDKDELEGLAASEGSGRLTTLAYDAQSDSFVDALTDLLRLQRLTLSDALLYRPATTSSVVEQLVSLVARTTVELLPSAVAQPRTGLAWTVADLPLAQDGQVRLMLGWKHDGTNRTWHAADEISAAALRLLDEPADRVLGVVSPWADRPV
jgi:hypothetical protein